MAHYKILCDNFTCKHHCKASTQNKETGYCGYKNSITIKNCECKTFEPNIFYYTSCAWEAMGDSNMILTHNLTYEVRLGLYYIMQFWNLKFNSYSRGDWSWVSLCNEDGNALNKEQIYKREFNYDNFQKCVEDFNNGKLPISKEEYEQSVKKAKEKTKEEKKKYKTPEYGFLAPDGTFYKGEWGTHCSQADQLIHDKGFVEEYRNLNKLNGWDIDSIDFLVKNKHYALIHSPNQRTISVDKFINLTKKQKDFLYGYFCDIGDFNEAENYVDD